MIKTSKTTTRRLLDIHGWAGVLLGLALYIVVFSGAIVVFSAEIGEWSVRGHQVGEGLAGKIDHRLLELSKDIPEEYFEQVEIWQNSAGYIMAFFHTNIENEQGQFRDKGIRFMLDPESLSVINRIEGLAEDMPIVSSSFLEKFYIDLHIKLHAPDPIGLYLTGILGLVLLISAISGLILHRHLIKDIFLSPRLSTRLLNTRDRHNLAGTWGIVFSIVLAFTGAFFSFAISLGLPIIAITAFGGDQQKAIDTIVGVAAVENATPRQFIGLENIVKQARQHDIAASVPTRISVQHWGRADAIVTTTHQPSADSMFSSNHRFNGSNGDYLGEKPTVGNTPSSGNTILGLMGVLHFGWFAGLLSQVIWLSLGLATCYVTLSGLQLWVQRRDKNSIWQSLSRFIPFVAYGLPIAMISAAMGFLLSYPHHQSQLEQWTINGFLLGIVASFVISILFACAQRREQIFQQLTALGLIALALTHTITSELAWSQLINSANGSVVAINIAFVIVGLSLLFVSKTSISQSRFSKDKTTAATVIIEASK